MIKKILIINPFGIGDVLFSTPLISAVKRIYPDSYIGYICNMRTEEILETNPDINELFIFERGLYREIWKRSKTECLRKFFAFWKGIKNKRFDIVMDLSLGKEYAFLCMLIGIKERRGLNYKNRGRFLTHKIPFDGFNDKPVGDYYLSVIDPEGNFQKSGLRTVLIPTGNDKEYIDSFLRDNDVKKTDALVGIVPGGGMSFGKQNQGRRRWPVEKFSELADRITVKLGGKIILIWGPGEEELVEDIKRLTKQDVLTAPRTTLRQMAAAFKRCKLVICSEGGPLHAAVSQGVRTISIFGPVDEKVYGPYPAGENNAVITSDAGCRPCYKRFKLPECENKKCLLNISVDKVFETVKSGGFIHAS
jgi:heptosyltransferase II